jgi:predicted dehydrogenase
VAVDKDELAPMTAAVREAGVKTVISFVLRWNPMVLSIREAIEKGWIGRPLLVQADYWHGPTNLRPVAGHHPRWNLTTAGAIVHGGCHAMDAARYVLQDERIVRVTGISPEPALNDKGYRSLTLAALQFADGAAGKVSGSTAFFMPYVFNVEVFGDEGAIRNNSFYSRQLPGQLGFGSFETILPDSGAVSHHPFRDMIDHFVDCILNDRESHDNLQNAVNTHRACFAAEESAAHGSRPINIDDTASD